MDPLTAALIGGGIAGSGQLLAGLFGSDAAGGAGKSARRAGWQAQDVLSQKAQDAMGYVREGTEKGAGYLGQFGDMLAQRQGQIAPQYSQDIDAGNQALQRLQAAILGGDTNALTMDPGYQFRVNQANKALERQSLASGNFGGGAYATALARLNQDLASQEYGNAVNRMAQLYGFGRDARTEKNSLENTLLGLQGQNLSNMSNLYTQQGLNLGNIAQTLGQNRAQAIMNAAGLAVPYQAAQGQAWADAAANIGNFAGQAAMYGLEGRGSTTPTSTSQVLPDMDTPLKLKTQTFTGF